MRGIDVIGASQSLSPYTIMLRVRSVDAAKLRAALSDRFWAGALPGAVQMVDSAPELALEVGLPIARTELEKMGITADITTTRTPPKGRAPGHQMEVVLGLGAVIGIFLAIAGQSLYRIMRSE